MKSRAHLFISGRVQGVSFRSNTMDAANRIGVTGWVKNLPDGMVESVAEGSAESVDKFVEFCKKGPDGSRVDSVQVLKEEFRNEFGRFEIRF